MCKVILGNDDISGARYIEPPVPHKTKCKVPCPLLFAYKEQSEYSSSVSEELLLGSLVTVPRFAILRLPAKFSF